MPQKQMDNFRTRFLQPDDPVDHAAKIIQDGGLVAIPTETVYGLAADALQDTAVAKIFAAKRRPLFDPLIVHVADIDGADTVAVLDDPRIALLADAFWPGPLTLVLPKRECVPSLVTSGLPHVAVRVPAHPLAHQLIVRSGRPLAAPSANPFGYLSPTSAEHVKRMLGSEVDYILDGGPCRIGVESTIVDLTTHPARLLRAGGITAEAIEAVLGTRALVHDDRPSATPEAPGRLTSHYAPRTPLVLVITPQVVKSPPDQRVGLLAYQTPTPEQVQSYDAVQVLSPSGDLVEAAARLFSSLHALDAMGLDRIDAQLVPETGLGRAIMERLTKAAATRSH